jgi:hypothetical protein
MLQHPDITAALRTGYPANCSGENRDTPEARKDYIEEHTKELLEWLQLGYPEILEEFIELRAWHYRAWLN